ncbi:hypothetical protein D1AOALGA4SA_12747 [Olavius algarvensis Delta 1 endosymbiont]|nr:hypothetical protein D1AOALGA4SA_12747 [Olavius algarvensis Delta 1 endosymbiont]
MAQFLFRSDWTLAARGNALVKLHKFQCYFGRSKWLVGVASIRLSSSQAGHDYLDNRG